MTLVENILTHCWPDKNKIATPFERITYDEAMEKYGSDKPDTRFDILVSRQTVFLIIQWNDGQFTLEFQLNNVTAIITANSDLTENVKDFAAYAIPFKFESGKRFHEDLADTYKEFVKNFSGKLYNAKIQVDVDKWAAKNIGCLSEESALNLAKTLDVEKGDRIFLAFGPKEETVKFG